MAFTHTFTGVVLCHILIGLPTGGGIRILGIAQRPEHQATDNRGQIDLVRETATVLLIRQEIHRQRQPTLAVTQDEVRQDGEDGFTCRTLDTPDGETAQPDPDVMRVTGQTPTATTGRLVFQLQAKGRRKASTHSTNALPSPRS